MEHERPSPTDYVCNVLLQGHLVELVATEGT